MQRGVWVWLLFGVLVCPGWGQTSTAKVNHSVVESETRDRSHPAVNQLQQTSQQHDENLWTCLTGYGECDDSRMTAQESQEIHTMEQRRNALACETTIGVCDQSLLTPEEAGKVAKLEELQNRLNCETGVATFY